MLVRCAIYTRQSVDTHNGLSSCQVQFDQCEAFVRSQRGARWVLVDGRFDDEGYSGASLDRPGFKLLQGLIRSGGVDGIIICRLDRLSRNLRDFVNLSQQLRDNNIGLTILGSPLLGEAALDHMMLNVMASVAEFEREMTASQMAEARAYLRSHGGRVAGAVPFGYTADPRAKQLVVMPQEAEVVTRMFEWAAAKMPPPRLRLSAIPWGGERETTAGGQRAKYTLR